jgi:hypothetical protein
LVVAGYLGSLGPELERDSLNIPDDLDLSWYIGAECISVFLGVLVVQFDFDSAHRYLATEGPFEVHNAASEVIYSRSHYARREPCPFPAFVDRRIEQIKINAPHEVDVAFADGLHLKLFTDPIGYESMRIGDGTPTGFYVF